MTTMTADDLADSINRGKKWKVIGCIGHDCEECQTRIAKDASHRSTAQEVDMKMVIDRAVVEQALEAMEAADVDPHSSDAVYKAITALLAALAQQAEPVEPVAWLQPKTVDGYSRPDLGYETCSKDDYGAFPVYTAPPQRKPLTEEVAALTAQRDALLEVLKYLDKEFRQHGRRHWPEAVAARLAIEAVEETK